MPRPLNDRLDEYQQLLASGSLQQTYKGLIEIIRGLKTHLLHRYPHGYEASSVHEGYLDFTYFPFTPTRLKNKKLKIIIVFHHPTLQFEICLVGQNKAIQQHYWTLFKNSGWQTYSVPATSQEVITNILLTERPNFNDTNVLNSSLETAIMVFIDEVTLAINRFSRD